MLRTPRKASSSFQSPTGAEPPTATPTAAATTTINNTNALNKTANSSTGIYQQSVYLRSRLHRLPVFAQFLEFSHSGPRATRDAVSQLWEMLSLGRPLCVLFNLQHIPAHVKITEYADERLNPDPLRKERQRAVALFIMGVNALKGMGLWEKDAPIFSIGELVGDTMNTNGFVKVVATVLYLLDKLPATVWSDEVHQVSESTLPSHESLSSMASREDMERANIVRELIETERKYCQDLETMQSYAESLRQSGIEDADTVHHLFPALGKLTDFQRKLLICMELTAENSLDEQDWGDCFVKHELEFAIYDAFIANYSHALDLAVAEQATLMAASDIINPLQLPAFLIKPVQRLCRYPMLLSSLLKLSSEDRPLHGSLVEGVAAVKRIADMANRALREKENEETLRNILPRIKDWKGLPLDNAGALLLDDVFGVVGGHRPYTEYHIFLFNRMLLLCHPKEVNADIETLEKESHKGDWLTHGFKKSLSSSALAVTVLPQTPKPAGPSAFLSGGAVTSRRAKTPFSIRGALYIRNIVDTVPKTSNPCALHIKYQARSEVGDWTLQCGNEEQVNLWNNEIQRLLKLWEIEEADIRRNAKDGSDTMKDQMLIHLSHESLDNLRSARRPAHPYESTFEASSTQTRPRNGSLNMDEKPDVKFGRSRSSSVSSMASDIYGPKYTPLVNVKADVSFPQRPLSRQASSVSALSEDQSIVSKAGDTHRARTISQPSSATIEVQKPPYMPPRTPLGSRIRSGTLPPQPPPPMGPTPPRPDEAPHFFPYERRTHSRQSSGGSEASFRPLPQPPLSLRQRVGDRMPAPLIPINTAPIKPSEQTLQSTLPELPPRDPRRPVSHRKNITPIKGPRGRTGATPNSGYHHAPPKLKSRTRSNSSMKSGQSDAADLSTNTHSNEKPLPRRPRGGSESSSTTDSVSIIISSEDQGQGISPLTPDSFEEENRQSLSKSSSQSTHKRTSSGSSSKLPVRVESLILSPRTSRRHAEYLSGATPKTAFHEIRDKDAILSGGLRYPKTSSDSVISHPRTPTVPSHSRNNNASGIGRTRVVNEPATITVRLHHEDSRFLLKVSYTASRQDFVDKIRRKIHLSTSAQLTPLENLPTSHFASEEQVSFLNEKNQFAPLEGDHDFSLAWKSVYCKRNDPEDEGILILAVGNTGHMTY